MGIHREFMFWFLPLPSRSRGFGSLGQGCGGTCVRWSPAPPGTMLGRETMESGSQAVPGPGGRALAEAAGALLTGGGNEPLCTGHEISHV